MSEYLPPVKPISPTLKADLERFYPEASPAEIESYIEMVRNYDAESLPPTKETLEYKDVVRQIKALEERKEPLRLRVLEQYHCLSHQLGSVKIVSAQGTSYNTSKLYDWAKENLSPEDLELITIRTVDEKKFSVLILDNKVNSKDLPEDIFVEKNKTWKVELDDARKRKPKTKTE